MLLQWPARLILALLLSTSQVCGYQYGRFSWYIGQNPLDHWYMVGSQWSQHHYLPRCCQDGFFSVIIEILLLQKGYKLIHRKTHAFIANIYWGCWVHWLVHLCDPQLFIPIYSHNCMIIRQLRFRLWGCRFNSQWECSLPDFKCNPLLTQKESVNTLPKVVGFLWALCFPPTVVRVELR